MEQSLGSFHFFGQKKRHYFSESANYGRKNQRKTIDFQNIKKYNDILSPFSKME
jgi:hypothetical protein